MAPMPVTTTRRLVIIVMMDGEWRIEVMMMDGMMMESSRSLEKSSWAGNDTENNRDKDQRTK
jgi:hypothetical protein